MSGPAAESQKPTFRVVEFNVLSNHAHFITEADDNEALSRGVKGLEVRKSPREVRNCLRYVLLNRKHHGAEKKFAKYWVDPCSSGAWFEGWREPVRVETDWMRELVATERPTVAGTTWLLRVGWRKHGLIAVDERPA